MLRKLSIYIVIALTLSACQKAAMLKDAPPADGTNGVTEISGVISGDTTLSGTVKVIKDVYVKEGITLTIKPGTTVIMVKSESTKVEPYYLSSYTEIIVRGSIIAKGTKDQKISFIPEKKGKEMKDYAGVILLKGGDSVFEHCSFEGAERAIYAIRTKVSVTNCDFNECFYAISAKDSEVVVTGSTVKNCDKGIYFHDSRGEVKNNEFYGCLEDALFINNKSTISVTDNLFKDNMIGVSTLVYKGRFLESNKFENNKSDVRALNYW
jgi:hypothetical protein